MRNEDIPNLAAIWITQGDVRYNRWDSAYAETLLRALRDFARTAVESHKPLLLWISL